MFLPSIWYSIEYIQYSIIEHSATSGNLVGKGGSGGLPWRGLGPPPNFSLFPKRKGGSGGLPWRGLGPPPNFSLFPKRKGGSGGLPWRGLGPSPNFSLFPKRCIEYAIGKKHR